MRAKASRAANRYARAIFDVVGGEKTQLAAVLVDLKNIVHLMQSSESVMSVLTNPAFALGKRVLLVSDLGEKIQVSVESKKILAVVARADRVSALPEIIEQIEKLRLRQANLVPIVVESAVQLSAEEKKRIISRFGLVLGKPVEPTFLLNTTLIGGFRAMANGKTYDGSVTGWLNNFQERNAGGV